MTTPNPKATNLCNCHNCQAHGISPGDCAHHGHRYHDTGAPSAISADSKDIACRMCGTVFVPADVLEELATLAENFTSTMNRLGGGHYENDVRQAKLVAREIAAAIRARIDALLGPK